MRDRGEQEPGDAGGEEDIADAHDIAQEGDGDGQDVTERASRQEEVEAKVLRKRHMEGR